jgi:hypothetical protein
MKSSSLTCLPQRAIGAVYERAWKACVARPVKEKGPAASDLEVYWRTTLGWQPGSKWASQIRMALSHHARIIDIDIPQEQGTGILSRFHFGDGSSTEVFFDYSDYPSLNDKWGERGIPYFKLQLPAGYSYPANVMPGGYIVNDPVIYSLLPHLRNLRSKPEKFDVYGRFGKGFALEFRTRCMQILKDSGHPMYGGFEFVRYTKFLREAARAKVCIDPPGNGPLCFRFIDYLAMGCCVIAYPHQIQMPSPLVHGEHLLYMKPDMSDLPELVEFLLGNPRLRKRLADNASRYFDGTLASGVLGRYYRENVAGLKNFKSTPIHFNSK